MEWIKVEDKTPVAANVIVAYKFGVGEAKYIKGKFVLTHDWSIEIPEVTHWMKLPSPPKED